jgi:DNA-binding MarR family transcriptional regulator
MEQDFLKTLGYHSIAARMKRIVELTTHSSRELYKELGVDIEPNWYLIFRLLEREGSLTIVEIAAHLQFAHPTVVNLIAKLKQRGYVSSTIDEGDSRRKPIQLTSKAHENLPRFKEIWEAAELTIKSLLPEGSNFLEELTFIEQSLKTRDFNERTKAYLNKLG